MKLLVGLGNPGKNYANTRHNVGFMASNAIASKFQTSGFKFNNNFNAEISERMIGGEKIILAKPQTFMNESGKTAKAIIDYYKTPLQNITVIHDDLDIALGEYKIAQDRNSAGHKGVQSIIDNLGTKDFKRIRIGIGIEDKKIPTEMFVLENFSKEEQKVIDGVIEKVCEEIEILIKNRSKINS